MAFGLGTNFTQQLQDITDRANSQTQKTIDSIKDATNKYTLPWSNLPRGRFFPYLTIKAERWDQLFPYRLLVINTKDGKNEIVGGTTGSTSKVTVRNGVTTLDFYPLGSRWIFQLPITPQQLSIMDQFAINTSATLRGVLEEHNGVKFKIITAAGTMGIWPFRESVTKPPESPTVAQSIFGGTLEAFSNLQSQAQRVLNTATSNHPANKPVTKRPESSTFGETSTGYYMALSFQQFLEQYAEAKKNPANAYWRLVFDIPKQNQSFIVTPIQFTWSQAVNKPAEINYNLQLKAWRRIDLSQSVPPADPAAFIKQGLSPGVLQRVLNTISEARKTTSAALNLIQAVRSDVEAPLEALRQTSLFVKDLAGVIITAADLPFQLQRDYKNAIGEFFSSLSLSNLTGAAATSPAVTSALSAIQASHKLYEGLSIDAVANGQLGNTASNARSIDPAQNIFTSPESNFVLMDQAPVNNLTLSNAQQQAVNDAVDQARSLTVDDLKQFRSTIQTLAQQLANNFGAGDSFVSTIYNLPAPVSRVTSMTVDDFEILKTLYDVMQSYDILTATTEVNDNNVQSNMDYVAGLADDASIPFSTPNSKILAPVPFGLTIEGIAIRYLGDPQRWIEIATLNNLRNPYIDEDGFTYSLLSNATGRQITVSSSENLFLGQRILLQSTTQTPSARRILGIDKLSDTSFLITLDGPPNLDNFITADRAYLHAYLPGTTNSQQKIFVPSDIEVPNDPNIVIPPIAAADPLSGMSKVDWLLTDTGDIATNNFKDFRLSYGITNIIQALKIKLGTKKGSVLLHPEFGFGIRPGTMSADIDVQQIYDSINELVSEDPRFQTVSSLQVSLSGPVLTISMAVQLAGQQGVFPVTFQLAA